MISPLTVLSAPVGVKPIKYWIDDTFRGKVLPVPGSVLYADLWVGAEHSGIYLDAGRISNIEVDGFAAGVVRACSARSFTSKSTIGKKIYVSCDGTGAVGHVAVANKAQERLGERSFYGLIIKNCHQFSMECVLHSPQDHTKLADVISRLARFEPSFDIDTWEPNLRALKSSARRKLGATKWRLWDWEQTGEPEPEPYLQASRDFFENLPLNQENMAFLREQLAELEAYSQEIADENIPAPALEHLAELRKVLVDIAEKYEQVQPLLAALPGAGLSYADLKNLNEDFAALASEMQNNGQIQNLARKLGRDYITQEKKKKTRISEMSKNEVHGIHRSDEVMRVLPCELVNLEDETLETLFYARLLEQNLLTYQLQGEVTGEQDEAVSRNGGPVVACLDTSGSMSGGPLRRAKALLLAIAGILQKEQRELHVLLFGSTGQITEHRLVDHHGVAGLLDFLQQGYGGGTDFETPLRRALDIIESQTGFDRADVLMVTDGECGLSPEFVEVVKARKESLDCTVYTVLCAGTRKQDSVSDEVVGL